MRHRSQHAMSASGILIAAVLLCLPPLLAAEEMPPGMTGSTLKLEPEGSYLPTPLRGAADDRGLAFDLAGSDVRKLQLQLAQPLSLQAFGAGSPRHGGLVLAGSSLNVRLGDSFGVATGLQVRNTRPGFTSLGSIHCENGVLDAGSYRASNCYFIDDQANSSLLSLDARYRLNEHASARVGVFQERAALGTDARFWAAPLGGALFADPLPPAQPLPGVSALGRQPLESEVTGIDLEFELGVSTDQAGEMVLGLQLTRVFDARYQGEFGVAAGISDWTLAKPWDSARLSFDWHQGAFSGGISSYYRAPVEFMNRGGLESYATFDVYFSWRAPWNASVSVGASNVLDAGKKEAGDSQLADPFESIYGRIPYVRYKQDL